MKNELPASLEELFRLIISQTPSLSPAEIDHARGELTLMNDRVFAATFGDNKHNDIITGTINAARKIHNAPPIPPIEHTQVQDIDIFDVFMRGMVGDLTGAGASVSIAVEAQTQKQDGYAVRGILTTGNAMRKDFKIGGDYTQAPDVITLHFLGFKLPELAARKMFCSRIVNAEFESGTPFLADKYSTYFIELPKMANFKKADLPQEYHDLWDLCCMVKSKVSVYKEEIKMQEITNPTALELADAVQQTVAPSSFVSDETRFKRGFDKFRDYMAENNRRTTENERRVAAENERRSIEEMLILAIQNDVPPSVILTMGQAKGVSESRLAELQKLAQATE